ncbi:MAG: GxxExxY protein [Verrucomicrobiota bacterium]
MSDSQLSYKIIGAAMKVHNAIGPGLREKPYENALRIELIKQGYIVEQQETMRVVL